MSENELKYKIEVSDDQEAQKALQVGAEAIQEAGFKVNLATEARQTAPYEVTVVDTDAKSIRTEVVEASDEQAAKEAVDLGPSEFIPADQTPTLVSPSPSAASEAGVSA